MSKAARTIKPVVVVVLAIKLTMACLLNSGWPRQFWVMKLNKRCSILFHLLVPGGKWQTRSFNSIWSANSCSAIFQSRDR